MLSPEHRARIEAWRRRLAAGEAISVDEMKEAIILLRGGRKAAIEAAGAAKSKTKAKAPGRSADDLLADF